MHNLYQRTIVDLILKPLSSFVAQQKSGSIVLAISVVLALILSNTALADGYHHFFAQELGFTFNGQTYFNYSLHHWINDGLMSIFFFVVGLELKHEFIGGHLSNPRNTILPVGAALGGMLVPALIYALFNWGSPSAMGWGIPMATDIAFALGVLYFLGDRVPTSVKVFLTTLAVVDDLGAVIVIALFYTSQISLWNLGAGVGFLLLMWLANRVGIKHKVFYALVGIVGVWTMFLLSGIHATIAAVLAAFMIPSDARLDEKRFNERLNHLGHEFANTEGNDVRTLTHEQLHVLKDIQNLSHQAQPPSQSLEHFFAPIVTFVIMPIFAIANAGISLADVRLSDMVASPIVWGVALGLLVGKIVGIAGTTFLLTRLKVAQLPTDITPRRLLGLAALASIGFTMSMFISTLAFSSESMLTAAKVGIFAASIIGGSVGYILLKKAA